MPGRKKRHAGDPPTGKTAAEVVWEECRGKYPPDDRATEKEVITGGTKIERKVLLPRGVGKIQSERKADDRATGKNRPPYLIILITGLILTIVPCFPSDTSGPVDLRQSVLKLECYDKHGGSLGHGSCFIVAEKNGWYYAVTARHCVEYCPDPWTGVVVPIPMLRVGEHEVEVLRKDPDADVALIRFFGDGEKYVPLSLADPTIGEACTTVGWAGGTFLQFQGHVAGFGFDKQYTVANSGLYPGCSGGVLLNSENEVIGVTVAVPVTRGSLWDTVGLYVPIKYVRALMETI